MDRAIFTYCLLILFYTVPNNDSSPVDESPKSKHSSSSRRGVSGSRHPGPAIHFPTDAPPQSQTIKNETLNRGDLSGSSISPCPNDALFCESADYPKDVIKEKLKHLPELLRGVLYEEVLGDEVHNKFGPGSEKELCTSKAQVVFPNKAKSKEGVFEFVVNDEDHKQGIRVETCMSNGGQCDLPAFVLANDYRSRCVQKYITRQLVVLNQGASSDVNGIITKPFEFPSCCSCVIGRLSTAESRFAGEPNTTPANMTAPSTTKPVKANPKTVV